MAKLSEGAVKLQTGIKNYTGGVENLKAGTSEMLAKDKLPLLSTTAKSVSEGFDKYVGGVSDAAGQIFAGAKAITDNAVNMPKAVDAVNNAKTGISGLKTIAEGVVGDIKTVKSNVEDAEKEIDGITKVAEISDADVTNAASAAAAKTKESYTINEGDINVDISTDKVRSAVLESLKEYDLTDDQINAIAAAAQDAADNSVSYRVDVKDANTKLGEAINEAAYEGAGAMANDVGGRISDAKTNANAAKELLSSLTGEGGTIGLLEGNANTVDKGIGNIGSTVDNLSGDLNTLAGGLSQISDGASDLQGAALAVRTNSNNLKAGAKAVYDGIGDNSHGVWGGVAALQGGLVQLTGENGENDTALNTGAAMISAGLSHVPANENDTPGLAQGLAAYTAGVSDLNGSMQTILDGTKKLDAGAKTLSAGASKLSGGVSELADGTEKLDENSGKLRNGASQLSEGAAKLADGMSEISSGALELKDGCIKLNEEGVQKLAKLYKTDVKSIEKRIDTLKDAAKSYKTFSGTANPDSIEKKD